MKIRLLKILLCLLFSPVLLACSRPSPHRDAPPVPSSSSSSSSSSGPSDPAPVSSSNPKSDLTVVAGGDLDLSRATGRRIRGNPSLDPFREIKPWLDSADLRFANLESPLCSKGDDDRAPTEGLVFAGPSSGASILKRGSFDLLSTANNHAYDFGFSCLAETVDNLDRAQILHLGTDPEGQAPMKPVVINHNGQSLAFLAVTGIFNDGPLRSHKAKAYLASLDIPSISKAISLLRPYVDWILVSVHIGSEYSDSLVEANLIVMRAIIDAGADLVLGHHSHTAQRVDSYHFRPIFHSFGNLVFRHNGEKPWTAWSYLARLRLSADHKIGIELCPVYIFDGFPRPQSNAEREVFFRHFDLLSSPVTAYKRGESSPDGCVKMLAPRM